MLTHYHMVKYYWESEQRNVWCEKSPMLWSYKGRWCAVPKQFVKTTLLFRRKSSFCCRSKVIRRVQCFWQSGLPSLVQSEVRGKTRHVPFCQSHLCFPSPRYKLRVRLSLQYPSVICAKDLCHKKKIVQGLFRTDFYRPVYRLKVPVLPERSPFYVPQKGQRKHTWSRFSVRQVLNDLSLLSDKTRESELYQWQADWTFIVMVTSRNTQLCLLNGHGLDY